jgi:hypothetical protein
LKVCGDIQNIFGFVDRDEPSYEIRGIY